MEKNSLDEIFVLVIRRNRARKTKDNRVITACTSVLTQLASGQSQVMDSSDGHTFGSTSIIVILTDRN